MHTRSQARRFGRAPLIVTLLVAATVGCHTVARVASGPLAGPDSVSVGYGTAERSRVSSSVASLDSTAIGRLRAGSLEDALRGLPGVEVLGSGPSARVRIRGAQSFLGSSDPLYVIDGIALPLGMAQPLSGINPHDVARIDVLKDASSSIYGVRGANGVVIITTKRPG